MTTPTDGRIDLDALAPCPHEHQQRSLGLSIVPIAGGNSPRWYVRCLDCGATGPRTGTRESAIAAWNRRAAIPSEQGEAALPRAEDGRIAPPLEFGYTNWRGEFSQRCAVPLAVRFGSTEWHPEPQWLLTAWDAEKAATRDFAMRDLVLASHPAPAAGVNVKAEALLAALQRYGFPVSDAAVRALVDGSIEAQAVHVAAIQLRAALSLDQGEPK